MYIERVSRQLQSFLLLISLRFHMRENPRALLNSKMCSSAKSRVYPLDFANTHSIIPILPRSHARKALFTARINRMNDYRIYVFTAHIAVCLLQYNRYHKNNEFASAARSPKYNFCHKFGLLFDSWRKLPAHSKTNVLAAVGRKHH